MAKITPVYYLESGTVKFWQKESATSSATVITPNAIVAKKQSLVEISYNPYEKHTVVAVYKGEAEVADLVTGKKMLLAPTENGKPRIAIVAFTSTTPSPSKPTLTSSPTQSNPGFNIGTLIVAGLLVVVLGYMLIKKRSHLTALYNRLKQWTLTKIRKGKNNE